MNAIFGGAEANVAVSLARFGEWAEFVTKIPDQAVGRAATERLVRNGVNISHVVYGGNRLGIYYYEKGAGLRSSVCIYDRAGSAIQEAESSDFDWEEIFDGADWFHLTGISGEAEAYSQFITALCQMAVEQKRVLDKPYDGDNDRFTMRIFMVRLNMKGPQFALARKLMMKHLTGNSGWRYEDSAAKSKNRNQPTWVGVRQLKNVYQNGIRVELIPMSDESVDDIHIGDYGTIVGVDEYGSVFVKLDNGSAFGLAFAIEQTEEEANTMLPIPFDLPEETASEVPSDAEAAEESEAPVPEDEPDAPDPEEDTLPNEDDSNEDED